MDKRPIADYEPWELGLSALTNADERRRVVKLIEYAEKTSPEDWQTITYRSKDGTKHCILSHYAVMLGDDAEAMSALEHFESTWSNSYAIGRVNDRRTAEYPQATPRERSIAYLRNLLNGTEDCMALGMERDFRKNGCS